MGTLSRFREKVVHQTQERCRQEEGDGVMSVPPLNEGILDTGIDRITLEESSRYFEAVADVQHGDRYNCGNVEPECHVHMTFSPLFQCHEEIDGEYDPYNRDGNVNGPLQLGVFLARRKPQRECNCSRYDDRLPAPERESCSSYR